MNFSIGTDSDVSTGSQQILPSPNCRIKAHVKSCTKAPAADSDSDTHLESSIESPRTNTQSQRKFSLLEPRQESPPQHGREFQRR